MTRKNAPKISQESGAQVGRTMVVWGEEGPEPEDRAIRTPSVSTQCTDGPVTSWSDWLTYDRVATRYGIAYETARKLKGIGGIRWSKVPGIGVLLYGPDIDRYIESHVPELARRMHEALQPQPTSLGGKSRATSRT